MGMTDSNSEELHNESEFAVNLEAAAALLKSAFPDIRCLRCGHDEFVLVDPPVYTERLLKKDYRMGGVVFFPHPKTVVLVCQLCGMTETHALDYLEKASKPIAVKHDV